ncbi:protein of unknown function [Modestobacter italicus]|uniref:Uncharacterized protein n=1 Tax=Modestobacter italicus (strain DSM 44449 / CECT 9708 / BC 501) TaxID=2732864 RepID=I4ERE2_MODI5|nr:hypothetical protein [Modestobacter marinus]CCH85955.1 protein of unknown function [Modestobacter marinus]
MTPPQPVDEPIWRELDRPREPSEQERRLLITLAAAVDEPMLHAQVATVVVDATCRCGCSSVRLCSGQPAIPTERIVQLSGTGRPDHFAVSATSRGRVDVVLHVMHGRVVELEVYDHRDGDGRAVPLDDVLDLGDVSVD